MILVLCEPFDAAALWAAAGLQEQAQEVAVVTTPELDTVVRWDHRVSHSGAASIEITLADGRVVSSLQRAGVLNRLAFVPTARLDQIGGADRDYAVQEMNAMFLSWLGALPGPVLNRSKPQGLGGNCRHQSAWAALAAQAGLVAATYRQSCDDDPDAAWLRQRPPSAVTVFAVGARAVAPLQIPQRVRDGCVRLARAADEALLGVDLVERPGKRWQVIGASPRPDLSLGGAPLIDALAEALAS